MSSKKPIISSSQQWMDSLKDPANQALAEFLRGVPFDRVLSICRATTGGLVKPPSNIDEAIGLLLNFSDSASILNRQAMLKDYLIQYLVKKNVKFDLKATKSTLCNTILKLWGTAPKVDLVFNEEKKPNVTEAKFTPSTKIEPSSVSSSSSSSSTSASSSAKKEAKSIEVQTTPEKPKELKNASTNDDCQVIRPYFAVPSDETEMEEDEDEDDDSVSGSPLKRRREEQTEIERETGQMLGFQFAEWFYTRLNKLEDFTPHHFWKDCNLMLYVESAANPREINVLRDGDSVCLVLRSLVAEEGCFFNPNTLNGIGIRGKINPHGLAQVMVCGTVHRGISVLGTFEQNFGLMKDPTTENKFKIKFTILRLRERSALMCGESASDTDTTMSGIIEEIE